MHHGTEPRGRVLFVVTDAKTFKEFKNGRFERGGRFL